jgi:hypothetical protein
MEFQLQKYLFYQGPKDLTWIFYTQFNNIFQTTHLPNEISITDFEETILYVHAFYLNNQDLITVFQTKDRQYHLLCNKNTPSGVDDSSPPVQSKLTTYSTLEKLWGKLTKSQRTMLRMPKLSILKLKDLNKLDDPHVLLYINNRTSHVIPPITTDENNQSQLEINYHPLVTSETLQDLEHIGKLNGNPPSSLKLINSFQITDFKWCHAEWAQSLEHLTLVKMYSNSNITAYHLKFLVDHLPKLKRISFHYCGKINLTALLGLLSAEKCQLESIIFDNSNMLCQGNGYSGVISEEQWLALKNTTLNTLYLNSSNVSLDIIDYLRSSCQNLNQVMLCQKVYEHLKENMLPPEDPPSEREITYFDLDGKTKMTLPANYELRNLLKNKFQAPFSNSMLNKIEKIMGADAVKELKPK